METIQGLHDKYKAIDGRWGNQSKEVITDGLTAFEYEYPDQRAEISIDTEEFTAVCPWSGLPDFGTLIIRYFPDRLCIELKSLKYYLTSFRGVGIVQEHAANRILKDLVAVCKPVSMVLVLDYKIRGGIHTSVTVSYDRDKDG